MQPLTISIVYYFNMRLADKACATEQAPGHYTGFARAYYI